MNAPEPLAEVALAFCREVLGWRMPVDRRFGEQNKDPFGGPSTAWPPYIFDGDCKHGSFFYTDLDTVMDAVAAWCRRRSNPRQSYGIGLTYGGMKKRYHASIKRGSTRWHHTSDDPRHALMSACLAAARNLKGVASPSGMVAS